MSFFILFGKVPLFSNFPCFGKITHRIIKKLEFFRSGKTLKSSRQIVYFSLLSLPLKCVPKCHSPWIQHVLIPLKCLSTAKIINTHTQVGVVDNSLLFCGNFIKILEICFAIWMCLVLFWVLIPQTPLGIFLIGSIFFLLVCWIEEFLFCNMFCFTVSAHDPLTFHPKTTVDKDKWSGHSDKYTAFFLIPTVWREGKNKWKEE